MGSLDVSSAKQQFFELVDAISASHLPSFTIWLDAKLAEYKTIGQLKPDSEYESKEQYPEWIGKALRQNLSFLFPGSSSGKDSTPTETSGAPKRRPSQGSDIGSEKKRSKLTSAVGSYNQSSEAEDDVLMIVKEEPGGKQKSDYSRVTETPLPGIQSTFSLSTEPINDFSAEQGRSLVSSSPAAFTFTTPSKSLTSPLASMTPPNQTLSASLPRPTFSSTKPNEATSSSKALNFGSPSYEPESMPLSSPSTVPEKVKALPQLSSSAGEPSVPYPVAQGAQSSDAEGAEGQISHITDEAVQDIIRRYHKGKPTYAVESEDIVNLKDSRRGGFTCPACGKNSVAISQYRRHFVTHTYERPFTCPYCPATFRDLSNCYTHQKMAHLDKPRVKVAPAL